MPLDEIVQSSLSLFKENRRSVFTAMRFVTSKNSSCLVMGKSSIQMDSDRYLGERESVYTEG